MIRALPRRGVFGFLPLSAMVLLLGLTGPGTSEAQSRRSSNFDRRIGQDAGFVVQPTPAQQAAERALRRVVPGLTVSFDRRHGIARSIRSHTDFLTGPQIGGPRAIGLDFVERHRELLGLTPADLVGFEVTDEVFSEVSGATHVYLRQVFAGIPVYHGQLQIHINRQGRVLGINNAFVRDLARSVNIRRPSLSASEAVQAAAEHLGLAAAASPEVLSAEPHRERTTRLVQPEISLEEIVARLRWLPIRHGDTRLVWSFLLHTPDRQHLFEINVDAVSGEVWTRFDLVSDASYRVYERPTESPQHTTPLPPADARTLVMDPEDRAFSPLGWHDDGTTSYVILRGNNVHAYDDRDANNVPPAVEPTCTGSPLVCDFSLDFTLDPGNSIPAAVTNLFYWNNVLHDIQARYGFDEAAGNFQATNFSSFGVGGDEVRAEAQDGSANCGANFATPTDGNSPRMQMFLCNLTSPSHDGALDAGVIVHEYGHGISIRQVGGPSSSSCLNNLQQPGEGWSDWFALVYTAEDGDAGTEVRGIASYLFGLPPNGTVRPQQYSTDPAFNNYTYESISGLAVPHGVGSVWAQVLWEMHWRLVDEHGFDEDLTNFSITNLPATASGNQRALLYVNEGLKNTACSPTFLDARDGILAAVVDFDSEDLCPVWESFANFGLGVDAATDGPNSLAATNGFELPESCQVDLAGPDQEVCFREPVTLGRPALPNTTYLWSPGGETTAQITVSPEETTIYTVIATDSSGASEEDSVTVEVADCRCGLNERFENDVSTWEATGLWHRAENSACASPQDGFTSPTHAFYYGQDSTCTFNTGATNAGTLTSPLIVGISDTSTLSFNYLREVELNPGPYDRTEVDIVTDSGTTTVFSLDSNTPSTAMWTSSGPIDLSAFQGQRIRVRFRFSTIDPVLNDFIGWFIDDVVISSAKSTNVTFDDGNASGWSNNSTQSDCQTGDFVVGTPAQMVSFGTLTQPDGDCTRGAGQAFYTAANISPSVDDVDQGMCVADSPIYSVPEESLATICYFHGQRSGAGGPTGDFFDLEVSIDGGPYRLLDHFGNEVTEAIWRTKGIWVPSGADVQFRVRVSDDNGPGDTVEGGVDDVMICPFDGTVP